MPIVLLILLFAFQQQASRPTQPTDPMPPPNMDYFVGRWSFDWNVPDSPLGPAGKMKGVETYKRSSMVQPMRVRSAVKDRRGHSRREQSPRITRRRRWSRGSRLTAWDIADEEWPDRW
jgi:hypothetical protein